MKRKFITALLAFSLTSFTFVSCGDDFIDDTPPYAIGSDNYFNSPQEYYNALVGAYDPLQSTYANVILGEIASDNTYAGGESATDVIGWQQVDLMTHNQVNSNLRDIWNWMYGGVNRAAYILEFKDKIEFTGKAQIVAEARFLKAYYYFELVKWFGGVPMKGDQRFKLGDELVIPRSSKEEVYAAIEQDLLLAIADLNPVAPEAGRITKGAAQALLGKVYLYQDKFAQSAEVLEQVITDNRYSLVQNTPSSQAYNNLFEESGENGPESLFEVQYTDVEGAGFGCLQCSEGNVAVGFSGPRGYAGPLYTSGFSFNIPTEDVADIFMPGDQRYNVTILDMNAWSAQTGASYTPGYKNTGFFNRKYIPRTRSGQAAGDLNLTNPNNYRAIRYADVLLMAAEALNRGGISDTRAQQYLNMVRRRAFNDTTHDINKTGFDLTEAIWDERRVELFGEGHRFFDLVRTGQAAANIPGFTANKNEVFPIPIEEIQFSGGLWTQNTNYNN